MAEKIDAHALHEAARRLVGQEVIYCVSGLIYGLNQHVFEMSRAMATDLGFDEDDALNLMRREPDVDDWRDAAPAGLLKVAKDGDCFKWKAGEAMWSPPFDTELEAYRDAFDSEGIDPPDGAEIFEHWIVSDWLATKLEERGETIARDILGGLTIWGRPTTGQAIAIDSVIEDIARAHFMPSEPLAEEVPAE